jgi:hypothetical protein
MRKRLWVCACLLLGSASASPAQVGVAEPPFNTDNAGPDFSATSAAKVTLANFLAVADSFSQPHATAPPTFSPPNLSTALLAEPEPAKPAAPSPEPRFVYGGREDYRWQLSLAFVWFRFHSSVYNSNEFGVKTTVTYFLNEWLGVEGDLTAAFGAPVGNGSQNAKIAVYGGGPKIAWRQKRWEPWLHGIFGGAHQGPQTSLGGRNSYSVMAGGGADYRWNPHLSFRTEADYVGTSFFHQTQGHFLFAGGAVIHF